MRFKVWTISVVLFGLFHWTVALAQTKGSTWDVGKICDGQCLYTSLLEKQVHPLLIEQIVGNLSSHMNFKRLLPGTAYRFSIDPAGSLQDFTIASDENVLKLVRTEDKYAVYRGPMHLYSQISTVRGWYSNLKQAVDIPGEAPDLSHRFLKIVMKDLEVSVDLQDGDRFRLVVEKIHAGKQLLRYGPIEAFEFRRGDLHLVATRFQGEYYDDKGRALKSRFLRFPLNYEHISSQFRKQRRHPILGGVRPHRGIDLAAPVGTPVWAVAEGEVKTAGWLSGYGKTVILRHSDGYESLYAHLKGFAAKIHKGAKVRKRQVIGSIGMTGLSTGPHLHYGLTKDGEHRDPLTEDFPRPLLTQGAVLSEFLAKKARMAALFAAEERAHGQPLESGDLHKHLIAY